MAKFKFYVSTGYVGASKEEIFEVDDEELEGKSEEEAEEYVFKEYYQQWLWEHIDTSWERED